MALVQPAAISHWSALSYHGLTEQIHGTYLSLTTTDVSVPRKRTSESAEGRGGYPVNGTVYRFVQVRPERYFGVERIWVGDARVSITNLERTLLDGLAMPQHCGGFGEVIHAFGEALNQLNINRITEYAQRLSPAVAKRAGWVLEHQGCEAPQLDELAALPIKGHRKLDPTGPRKGVYNNRWMLQENLSGMAGKMRPLRIRLQQAWRGPGFAILRHRTGLSALLGVGRYQRGAGAEGDAGFQRRNGAQEMLLRRLSFFGGLGLLWIGGCTNRG